jgi:hypothetical protein
LATNQKFQSTARVAAGAFGFLIFNHTLDGPDLYCAFSLFETMPSRPRSGRTGQRSGSIALFDGLPESSLDKLLCNFAKLIFAASSLNHSLRDILGDIA